MIVVRIELWPKGIANAKRTLATMAIANVGGDHEYGTYDYAISHQAGSAHDTGVHDPNELMISRKVWKRGTLQSFKRQRGAVKLVYRVLKEAFA